jgi:hypothetical protein
VADAMIKAHYVTLMPDSFSLFNYLGAHLLQRTVNCRLGAPGGPLRTVILCQRGGDGFQA